MRTLLNVILRRRVHFAGRSAAILTLLLIGIGPACAQIPFIGEITLVPYNFAMRGYAECNGQLLPISQNTALFSLLGTTYGGDGRITFALPDLRDRVPIHAGQGPGLSLYVLGQMGGESSHSLTIAEMPAHGHLLSVFDQDGSSSVPLYNFPAKNAAGFPAFSTVEDTVMSAAALGMAGGGQPHNNLQPYLGLKFVIALQGVFPSRP
jgi:microcystin-dependent protein